MIDFVHPATTHDESIVTLHSLLDRDVCRGGAIVVGPVRRGRGRKVRSSAHRRSQMIRRSGSRCWNGTSGGSPSRTLNHSSSMWAAWRGRVTSEGWRRAKAMRQHDRTGELRRRYLLTCVQRNRNAQLGSRP